MTVYSLWQTEPALPLPLLGLELECGGGFYVRTLIEDLARALGTRGHMTALERTKQVWWAAAVCSASSPLAVCVPRVISMGSSRTPWVLDRSCLAGVRTGSEG